MPTETEEFSSDVNYIIFRALSHPTRVRMLLLIEGNELTFSSLKRELGFESSGQLQHHLQKLSDLIKEEQNGNYGLTDVGIKALQIYRESEKSGKSLEDICCIPITKEIASRKQVGGNGILFRFSIGSLLLALTAAVLLLFIKGQTQLWLQVHGSSISFGLEGAIIFGFFGISFLISAVTGFPGCEITAIPNLFTSKKRYCSCLMTPFNLPNGRLLRKTLPPYHPND